MAQNSLQRSLRMRSMGLHMPSSMKTWKKNKKDLASRCHNYIFQMSRKSSLFIFMSKRPLWHSEVENISDEDEFTFFTASVLRKQSNSSVNSNWILLHNQSTVDEFCNATKKLREFEIFMQIHCITAIMYINMIGDLPWYGMVWYHKIGIAIILSLANVKTNIR